MSVFLRVFRLEFLQPDGRWTGPYCAEYLTERAFAIRDHLIEVHVESDLKRPWPDRQIFASSGRENRYVCATTTMDGLVQWFGGEHLADLVAEGGNLATYDIPTDAIASLGGGQVVYMQRRARLVRRLGRRLDPSNLTPRFHPTKKQE